MEKVPEIAWPPRARDEIAVKLALPRGPITLNQTALKLGDGEIAVFVRAQGEPVVVRESTSDLSFEIDGFVQGLAQLFYSRPYVGDVWLVRPRDLDVGWAEELAGTQVSVGFTCVILEPAAFVGEASESLTDADVIAWLQSVWAECFRSHALELARRGETDEAAWEEAAATAEAWATPRLAARGLKIEQRLAPVVRAVARRAPPDPAEALQEALAWVASLQDRGALALADGVVPEMAAIAIADRLLADGLRLADAAGEAAARKVLAGFQSSASSSVQ